MSIFDKLKKAVKPQVDELNDKLVNDENKLESNVKALLDRNEDGILSIDDFFFAVKQGLDTNGNKKVDFWEIIAAFFAVRKILKKYEKK